MSDWIRGAAAVRYLASNYPFDDLLAAIAFFDQKLADGSLRWHRDPRIPSEHWEEMRAEDNCPEHVGFNCVEVTRKEIQKLFPSPPKHRGGRPTEHDYEGGLIHLAKLCYNEASFKSPSKKELEREMRDWMVENHPNGGPTDIREIRKRVDRFYREIFDEE